MFSLDSLRGNGFSWLAALSFAAASKLSYQDKMACASVTHKWGFASCDFLDVADTQGFIAQTDDLVVIAFRGTESLADWLADLTLLPAPWPPQGIAHSGFLSAYGAVRGQIVSTLVQPGMSRKKLFLTGHSLGGALATIAAAELMDTLSVQGVYTFGQPRLGDSHVHDFFKANFEDRFFRFVNHDDLVTRIPPNFGHVGKLIHFDAHGEVERAVTEAEASAIEEPPLSRSDFDKLQNRINEVRAVVRTTGAPEGALNASIEGLFPSLSEHRLERYIAIIGRHAGVTNVDPDLIVEQAGRRAIERSESVGGLEVAGSPGIDAAGRPSLAVLLRVRTTNWQAPAGLKVNSQFGTVVSGEAPLDLVRRLQLDPDVTSVDVSREGGNLDLTHSLPFIGADIVHRPPIEEQGDAALIGIIDTGADVLHMAFLDAAGRSRILAIWNQRDAIGPSPKVADPANFTQDYGTLYLPGQIAAFASTAAPPPENLRDTSGMHGTHVTSIAAGRAVGTMGDGMAPQARIVVVIPDMKTEQGAPSSIGYSASHVDALDFLKRVSGGHNRVLDTPLPMAVNVSLGMNAGAHDGTSTLEAAFDGITNSGRDPGFVIVKSAGNERGRHGHVRAQLFQGLIEIEWRSLAMSRLEDYIEAWYGSLDEVEFTLVDPAGNSSELVSLANPKLAEPLGGNLCRMELTQFHPDNGASRLVLSVSSQAQPIQVGTWSLRVIGKVIRSRNPLIDLWAERDDRRPMAFIDSGNELTLSIPGTANTVITVAACHSAEPLQLTDSSSLGLTRDARSKPDICAPGNAIIAAKAGDADGTTEMTGTSMAAPHVTGAIALVLSKRHKSGEPQVNARQIQAALVRTVKNFSGVHNSGFGFGMLDAEAFFRSL